MSKAVTNEEVEDVLSSIRRLVSEDKRPLAGLRSAPSEPVAEVQEDAEAASAQATDDMASTEPDPSMPYDWSAQAAPDRLVLTPALRVAEARADTAQADEDGPLDLGAVARETWTEDEPEVETDAEEAAHNDDAPLMLFPDPQEPATQHRIAGEDPAMDAVDALVHDALEADDSDDDNYSDESYWDDEPVADSPADYDIEAQELLREEEASHALGDNAADTYNDNHAPVEDDELDVQPEPEMFEAEAWADHEDSTEEDTAESDETNISILPLTAKIAALEAAVSGIKQEWEPDGTEEEDLTAADATAMAWEDDVDLDARGAPVIEENETLEAVEEIDELEEPETVSDDTDTPHGDDRATMGAAIAADDQLLDEDALRELVSEIVRAELQGALGERITRNVRKLVRREIHRALTAQELE